MRRRRRRRRPTADLHSRSPAPFQALLLPRRHELPIHPGQWCPKYRARLQPEAGAGDGEGELQRERDWGLGLG
uniref:Uncharacterized protein n=1 Tax=Leersia perrieri TaxID=77586 RepID=A0A0D9X0L2_9ORYZ